MKKYNGGMKKQDVGIIVLAVILLLLFLSWNAFAAEILVKATDSIHPNPTEDLRGSYKRGYPVVVMPDGHIWGSEERLPKFVVIKIPLISVEKVQKYIQTYSDFTKIPILNGDIWIDNNPETGYINWNTHTLSYAGIQYVIESASINKKYIYWIGGTTYQVSDTFPLLSDGQFIIAYNIGGLHRLEYHTPPTIIRRLWQIRWADLPLAARNKLQTTGQLTIKATAAYIGTYDYTWTQIKTFMRNLKTGLDETEGLQ